jgi:hypothetical protein
MAIFTAYFDASGSAVDQPFIIVSGYVANYLQWKMFENEWGLCHAKYGLDIPFHMAEFVAACEQPAYKNQRNARADYVAIAQDPEKALDFLKQLSGIQRVYVHCGISCIVPMSLYQGVSSLLDLRKVVPPYALGARMCIERLHQWEKQFAIQQPAEYIFELGDFEQGQFTHLMVDEGQSPPIYKKKAEFAGLQGADEYAWEQFYFLKGHQQGLQRDPRPSFQRLLHEIPKLHTEPTLETLIKLCEAKGIDPRTGITK